MHVCYVAPAYHSTPDDIFMPAIADMVKRVAAVHEVTVIALRHPSRRAPFELGGATVICLGHAQRGGLAGRGRVLGSGLAAVVRRNRQRRIDLLHGLWIDEAGSVASVAARLLRRPSIASIMGGELVGLADIRYGAALGLGGRLTSRVALRLANVVTAQSSSVLALAHAHGRADARLLPLGVDRTLFHPAVPAAGDGEGTEPARVLYVGNLMPVKDPLLLVRAFARLADSRQVMLDIVGDGWLRPDVEHTVDELGLSDRVTFHGKLAQAELARMYRAATVLAVPSRYESQSVVAVEAVASGLPVVGSSVGIVPDLGEAGLSVPVGDEAALANALARVLDDPSQVARMTAAARDAAADLDVEVTSRRLLDLYEEVGAR